MDNISLARLALLHPELVRRWQSVDAILLSHSPSYVSRIVQGLRTWPEQGQLYAKGRTRPGEPCHHNGVTSAVGSCAAHPLGATVTRAKPGESTHNYGLALDAGLDDLAIPGWQPDWDTNHESWLTMLRVAKDYGLAEGAEWRTFPDAPHFYPVEVPRSPDDNMKAAMAGGGLEAVWDLFPQLAR